VLFGSADKVSAAGESSNVARQGGAVRIESITPEGRSERATVSEQIDKNVSENGALSFNCRLAEGDNTFILALPSQSALDHLVFVNENATASGRLRISVSDQELPAVSANWVPVDGSVAFTHKRCFNVSMLGVNAKFVRLTFSVQRETIAAKTNVEGRRFEADFNAVNSISVYRFHPSGSDPLAAMISRSLAENGIAHVSQNLAWVNNAVGFLAASY
jgi:hypothetical protein